MRSAASRTTWRVLLAASVVVVCCVQQAAAISTQTTAKRVPGLGPLLAFKHHEHRHLGLDIDVAAPPRAVLSSILDGDDDDGVQGEYGPHTFTQPLDHFADSTAVTFPQRYWISTKHYSPSKRKPTPIYVVDGGETSGANRLPFLEHGILDILAEATGGISIVLEHRYYGASKPRLRDLNASKPYWDVDALRWLTNEQALEDSARFIEHIKLPHNLTRDETAWIYIGGSYAGARAAHMRVLYPHLVYGAISTSGVTAAIDAFPQYYYPIARGAEPACSQAIQAAVAAFDELAVPAHHHATRNISSHSLSKAEKAKQAALRRLFKAPAEDLDWDDLANLLTAQLGYFQALNWDPAVSSPGWHNFCDVMTNRTSVEDSMPRVLRASSSSTSKSWQRFFRRRKEGEEEATEKKAKQLAAYEASFARSSVRALQHELSTASSSAASNDTKKDQNEAWQPPQELLRLASYVRAHFIEPCTTPTRANQTLRQCFSTKTPEAWREFVRAPVLRADKAWMWQVCTQWGYFQGAAPGRPSISNTRGPRRGGGGGEGGEGERIRPHGPSVRDGQGWAQESAVQRPMQVDEDEDDETSIPAFDTATATALTSSTLFSDRAYHTAFTPGPRLVSSLLTLEYTASYCPLAFPPTAQTPAPLPDRPDIGSVNRLGAFEIGLVEPGRGHSKRRGQGHGDGGVDRLAIINGQWDPWRPATPHSEEFARGGARPDTLLRPFKLIPDCWHHCDQNGLPSPSDGREERLGSRKTRRGKNGGRSKGGKGVKDRGEPERIRKIHEEEVEFVKAWLAMWKH